MICLSQPVGVILTLALNFRLHGDYNAIERVFLPVILFFLDEKPKTISELHQLMTMTIHIIYHLNVLLQRALGCLVFSLKKSEFCVINVIYEGFQHKVQSLFNEKTIPLFHFQSLNAASFVTFM